MADDERRARPRLTQREAAEACGVSRTTIRRRREAGDFPGAVREGAGWVIPIEDLIAAGLRPGRPAGPDPAGAERPATGSGDADRLRAELAEARVRLAAAEAEAAGLRRVVEAQTAHLETAREALRALAAAPAREALPPGPREPSEGERAGRGGANDAANGTAAGAPGRRWWRRSG